MFEVKPLYKRSHSSLNYNTALQYARDMSIKNKTQLGSHDYSSNYVIIYKSGDVSISLQKACHASVLLERSPDNIDYITGWTQYKCKDDSPARRHYLNWLKFRSPFSKATIKFTKKYYLIDASYPRGYYQQFLVLTRLPIENPSVVNTFYELCQNFPEVNETFLFMLSPYMRDCSKRIRGENPQYSTHWFANHLCNEEEPKFLLQGRTSSIIESHRTRPNNFWSERAYYNKLYEYFRELPQVNSMFFKEASRLIDFDLLKKA